MTTRAWRRASSALVSRAGAWVVLVLAVLVAGGVSGLLGGSNPPGAVNALPTGSESATVRQLQERFLHSNLQPVTAVFTRGGERLTASDLHAATTVGDQLAAAVGRDVSAPIESSDHRAVLVNVPIDADRPNSQIATTVQQLRTVAHEATPDRLTVQITGGPAFGADIAAAFDGANLTLLAVTVGVVALLLLLTYRSPVLWLVPLAVVGVADQVAGAVTAWAGARWDLPFDAGIISVLVFGAGTNYALLLISRYREELRREADHRAALATAWRGTAPAILASNVTVVLSLLTLVLASMPSTRGLGIAAAIGLAIALVFALGVLPAALAVCGRRLFWPFVPRVGDDAGSRPSTWERVARGVTRRPAAVVTGAVLVLAVLGSGLLGAGVGLSQLQQFRVPSESAAGLRTLAAHYPAGEAQPMVVLTRSGSVEQVQQAAAEVPGVVAVRPTGSSSTGEAGWTRIMVVGRADPDTPRALDTVRDLRAAVHAVPGAHALVGGPDAQTLDVRSASAHDLRLIAPVILAVVLGVLLLLLRAVVAPLLLVLVNSASAVAAIGAGAWVGRHLFGFPALDVNVPLIAFLFLVALGIDYTIFLVHRAQQEAALHGTREGVVQAVSHTGAVITSAGVVLAAVFAALGVLPLVTLGQLGLIVGLGVLLDTLFVRTVLVPALFALVGDRMWWPGRTARRRPGRR
ncbi:MAG TPA: MMPL family transporter [Segeticoccus sp.]|uniref:MMPL family transporter n=1 Tax=Segeticoccus sp. TaxID=2706531 RepID=UPI002D810F33|nr:MMPL family transporter [Segeticoccus sp.]HET8600797.1 MMPL family transporter [Segeticoccus sp.]